MTPTEAKSHLSKYRDRPFREHQEEAISFIANSEKRFIFISAPTGSGKTCIGMVSGVMEGGVTYSVHTKLLQEQVTADHPEAKSLFGRSNYPCLSTEGLDCSECFHTKEAPCREKSKCLYEIKKREVLSSRLRILNFSYLLHENNFVGKFSGSDFNVVDEADSLEDTLINFTSLIFTAYGLKRLGLSNKAELLNKTSKYPDQLLDSWKQFGSLAEERAKIIINRLSYQIDSYGESQSLSSDQLSTLKERTRVIRLLEKIKLFSENVDSTWKLDDSQEGRYLFRPLWMSESLAESFMWRHAKKWVLLSASFLPINLEARRLGIPLDEIDFMSLPSTFKPERRRIYVESACNLTSKTMAEETPKLINRIREIIDSHANIKFLIHSVSYKLCQAIINGINSPRFITHNGSNRQEVLDMFKESDQPLVLCSPSLERGVSLEQDLCRGIIVAKAPFGYLGDPIISARVYGSPLGKVWYDATMLNTVLQSTGRGMRSEDDSCETWILDEQFKRVFLKSPLLLPEWWKEAVEFQ
jgi:ATP-dependent DNA helicase DinG